jgi:predicted nuclease of predicted toxin-antitoxin system
MPDIQIFLKAGQEDRIVMTLDLDFGRLATILKSHQVGVMILRLANPSTARAIARVEAVLASSAELLLRGAIVVVEDARHRVRMPAESQSPT